jgi:hypothetical protein
MKKEDASKRKKKSDGEMRREYKFDYRKARPNRFASAAAQGPLIVMVDPDVAEVFRTPESVNRALRALIAALPKQNRSEGLNRR